MKIVKLSYEILAYTYLNTKVEIFLTKHTGLQWAINSLYHFINSSFPAGYENLVLHINNISKLTGSLSLSPVCVTIHWFGRKKQAAFRTTKLMWTIPGVEQTDLVIVWFYSLLSCSFFKPSNLKRELPNEH